MISYYSQWAGGVVALIGLLIGSIGVLGLFLVFCYMIYRSFSDSRNRPPKKTVKDGQKLRKVLKNYERMNRNV
jgi:uncharacterized oligopeptide transporter (OPT) family protein